MENRSTGLQWFLSFFLVFLVESKDAHEGAILLLDEPGLTLHPHAQRDLSSFFDNLSGSNQLIFSTHSPFMIDTDKLERVKAVYTDESGKTLVSSNLRSSASLSVQSSSIYAAHAALGLTVSEVFLQGCLPVIVEGPSDQYYLSAIKTFLIQRGDLNPPREIVFIPSGGTKSIKAIASILTAKEEKLPIIVVDSDSNGKLLAKNIKDDLYASQKDRVITIGDFLTKDLVEVEDLLPPKLIADIFSRTHRTDEIEFSDNVDDEIPIVPQMEMFAKSNGLTLHTGWKVDLGRAVKKKILASPSVLSSESKRIEIFKALFDKIIKSV